MIHIRLDADLSSLCIVTPSSPQRAFLPVGLSSKPTPLRILQGTLEHPGTESVFIQFLGPVTQPCLLEVNFRVNSPKYVLVT